MIELDWIQRSGRSRLMLIAVERRKAGLVAEGKPEGTATTAEAVAAVQTLLEQQGKSGKGTGGWHFTKLYKVLVKEEQALKKAKAEEMPAGEVAVSQVPPAPSSSEMADVKEEKEEGEVVEEEVVEVVAPSESVQSV